MMQHYRPDWTWMKDVAEMPVFKAEDDIEVMFHGGSTARGNLYSVVSPALLMAYRVHGNVPHSDLDTVYDLVWAARPGINKVDRSYVRAFG
jgi:hypothetical protein